MMDKQTTESSLDKPQEGLCPEIWQQVDGQFQLTPEAQNVVDNVIRWVAATYKLSNFTCRITGSITSNQWSKGADIDLHFSCFNFNVDKTEEFNKLFRETFKHAYVEAGMPASVGKHPIEIYMQPNIFQDYMSIGCFDVLEKKWLVGPTILSPDYNPYERWWEADMEAVDGTIQNIRDCILRGYEQAAALLQLDYGTDTFGNVSGMLASTCMEAKKLMNAVRQLRKMSSQPQSPEEAAQMRASQDWMTADTAFKLLDKYGYTAILKILGDSLDRFEEDESDVRMIATDIVAAIKQNLANDEKLLEIEQMSENAFAGKNGLKLWIDDLRPAPEGYQLVQSVNEFVKIVDEVGVDNIAVVDIDHDAGDFQKDGGDYIRCLDYLEYVGAKDICVRLHSANPVGIANMRRIIKKNGWKEVVGILDSDEIEWDNENELDEGVRDYTTKLAFCAMMAIPGIMSKEALGKQFNQIPDKEFQTATVNSPVIKDAIKKATVGKSYNGMNATNIINAVARTIYAEGKDEKAVGQDAIASVIWNRAGGKPEKFVEIVSAPSQFTCWRKYDGGWKDETYKFVIPPIRDNAGAKGMEIWKHCLNLATQMYNGSFTSTIGNRNSYMNKKRADPANVASWGNKLDLNLGNHYFGYFSYNDGFRSQKTTQADNIYVVKAGDYLGKIAKDNGTTIDQILAKNNLKDKNKLQIGQKLYL